jgi:organic radical activating enzyme
MFGKNPILKPKKGDGTKLDIQEIFSTFQGEGIYTGYSSIFIRLGGCNLACNFCDTQFDSFKELELSEILNQIDQLNKTSPCELIVITGGEPLRQNIKKLCENLLQKKFLVQIETNGTLFQDLPSEVDIICSPKNTDGKYHQIRPDLLKQISAFKFLISAQDKKYQEIPQIGQSQFKIPVNLQPIDEYDPDQNLKNQELTLKLAKKSGCRLSLQTHKIWNID